MKVILIVNQYAGNRLIMQDDGNLVLYNNVTAVWNSGHGSVVGGNIAPPS